MERRRAFAWAGSITLTACASALVLGSLVGGFGFGAPPAQETEVTIARPTPGGVAPEPTPGGADSPPLVRGTDSGPVAEGTEAEPAPGSGKARRVGDAEATRAAESVPAVWHYAPSPAADRKLPTSVPISSPSAPTGLSGAPVPQRDLDKPATSAARNRAVAPSPNQLRRCDVAVGDPAQPTRSSLRQSAATTTVVALGGAPAGRDHRAQHVAPVLGQSPGGGPKTAAAEHVGKGRSDNDG
jgi:hypothetical protein